MLNMFLTTNTSGLRNYTTPNTGSDGRLSFNSFMGIFFMCFYIVVYTTSTIGNFVVLYICYKNGRSQPSFQSARTAFFNVYVASLAIADLVFTQLTVFDVMYAILGEWVFGSVMCKFQGFLIEMFYSASILTLTGISRERLKSLSDLRMKSRIQRNKERKRFALIFWIMTLILCSPLLYAYGIKTTSAGIMQCRNSKWLNVARRIYYSLTATVLFFLPLVIMIWTHAKINQVFRLQVAPNQQMEVSIRARQRKVSRTLGVVTVAFFLLWSPFILIRTLRYFNWYEGEFVWKLSQLLTIASAAANSFIYSFYSEHFRVVLKRAVTCRCNLIAVGETGESFGLNSMYYN